MNDDLIGKAEAAMAEPMRDDGQAARTAANRRMVAGIGIEGRLAIKGADADLERSVTALADLSRLADQAASDLAARARRGERVDHLALMAARDVEDQLKARASAAQTELKAAQERAYAALLPDVTDGDTLAADRKRDLERALAAAGGEDAVAKFTAVWQRFAGKGDRLALRLLASDFGRDAFVLAGGKADAYDGIRDHLRATWATGPEMRDNPTAKRLAALTGVGARKAIDGTAADVRFALDRVNRSPGGRV